MNGVFEVTDLRTGYGKTTIVHSVSMSVSPGRVIAVVGPNGAGKSTFLKGLAGLTKVTGGRIALRGSDITTYTPEQRVRAGLSYVPQVRNVFPSMTVMENLEMGGYTRRTGLKESIESIFELFPDLANARRKEAGKLSGGQRTLLGMARGLMLTPAVLLLDEPTAGVAPKYVDTVWASIKNVAASGTGIAVVEQNVDRAVQHADVVSVLVAGVTALTRPAVEISREELTSLFLGRREEPGSRQMDRSPGIG